MIHASFLRAFGKVLFSVTAGKGGLADEEKVLLTLEVERTLSPLMRKQPNSMFWRPLFDFEQRNGDGADALVAELLAALPAGSLAAQAQVRTASLELLVRMAETFGRGDQQTQSLIAALEKSWQISEGA
jgi:hypothetical protein